MKERQKDLPKGKRMENTVDFPVRLPFSKVLDDPIENYEVILYYLRRTGSRSYEGGTGTVNDIKVL